MKFECDNLLENLSKVEAGCWKEICPGLPGHVG